MEGAYRHAYLANQNRQAKNYDLGRFDRKGKSAEKELEFFKGMTSQASNIANQIEAGGYDTNSITKLEELLSTFQSLYNNYAQEKVRNPAVGASENMRQIMDNLRDVLIRIQQSAPQYAERVKEHLRDLDSMYVKTGGGMNPRMVGGFIPDNEKPNAVGTSSMGRYSGDVPYDVAYHEPTLAERMAKDGNIPLYEEHRYSKMAMNSDWN